MLPTSSEPQFVAPQLQGPGDDLNQVSLLRHRISAGKPFAADCCIQEADVCSAAPADLVRNHALGTDLGEGKGTAWYFCSPANYHQTPGFRRRKRKVGGGGAGAGAGETCWHVEKVVSIIGPDRKSVVAYKRTLSYVQKIKNPPGTAKPFRNKSLGWIMVEIELKQQDCPDQQQDCQEQKQDCPDQQQLVLCKVYRSPRTDAAEASVPCTASSSKPSSSSFDDLQVTTECKTTLDHNLCSPVVARKPAPFLKPGGTQYTPMGGKTTRGVAIVKKGLAAAAVVMKFGGSSMKSPNQMKETAKLVLSFPAGEGNLVAVVSAMGNTTTNLLLAAGKAARCGAKEASEIRELAIAKEMHFRMIDDLGLDWSIVSGSFDELECVFMGIAVMKDLTSKTRDYLVSFGENVSTRIFSAYLNELGKSTCQEWELYVVNTCGRGGSDLTATTIAREMGAREIQIWKDVDGVLTCNPNVCANAKLLPYLTFDEAAELGLFGAQSMQLAMEGGMRVIVKNLCSPQAPGTVITKIRDMNKSVLTSIVLRSNVTVLNIQSTRMVDQSVFLATSFSIFGNLGISVDCVAISEGKISLIVVPPKLSSCELVQLEVDNVVEELQKISVVDRIKDRSVISLVTFFEYLDVALANARATVLVLVKVFNVLQSRNVVVQKFSHGSSKVLNISLVVDNDRGEDGTRALHSEFFEKGFVSEAQGADRELNGSPVQAPESSHAAAARSRGKRKADEDHHREAPPNARQERSDTAPVANDPMPVGNGNDGALGSGAFEVQPEQQGLSEMAEDGSGPRNALDELERDLLSEDDPMQAGGDNGGCPDGYWAGILQGDDGNLGNTGVLPVGRGEQATPQPAPGAETGVDAGQGSWTGHERTQHQLSPDNDLRPAVGDPGDFFITEDFPGQFDAEEYTQRPIDLDVGWHWVTASEAEPQQQQVPAEGGPTVEEMLEEISPGELLGPYQGAGV